jgi:GNAT superfamily N-acetyltransferase
LLDAMLGERGWEPSQDNHIMVNRLDTAAGEAGDVTVGPIPDEDWFRRYRGGAGDAPASRELLLRHPRLGFAAIRQDGEIVAIGRGTIDDDWLGVTAVDVVPGARRRGLATSIMGALWAWGREHGAVRSFLHVESANDAAVAMYTRLGYWVHHDYRTRTEPAAGTATEIS